MKLTLLLTLSFLVGADTDQKKLKKLDEQKKLKKLISMNVSVGDQCPPSTEKGWENACLKTLGCGWCVSDAGAYGCIAGSVAEPDTSVLPPSQNCNGFQGQSQMCPDGCTGWVPGQFIPNDAVCVQITAGMEFQCTSTQGPYGIQCAHNPNSPLGETWYVPNLAACTAYGQAWMRLDYVPVEDRATVYSSLATAGLQTVLNGMKARWLAQRAQNVSGALQEEHSNNACLDEIVNGFKSLEAKGFDDVEKLGCTFTGPMLPFCEFLVKSPVMNWVNKEAATWVDGELQKIPEVQRICQWIKHAAATPVGSVALDATCLAWNAYKAAGGTWDDVKNEVKNIAHKFSQGVHAFWNWLAIEGNTTFSGTRLIAAHEPGVITV